MDADTTSGSPWPDAIGEHSLPAPGPDLGAVDYRRHPSHGMRAVISADLTHSTADRDDPVSGGTAVGPMADRTITSYDLPSQPTSYDRMGLESIR